MSPQSVRVRWDPPPLEHRNGVIEGYKVLYRHVNLLGGEKQTAYLNSWKVIHWDLNCYVWVSPIRTVLITKKLIVFIFILCHKGVRIGN